jgi:hypothetical protein
MLTFDGVDMAMVVHQGALAEGKQAMVGVRPPAFWASWSVTGKSRPTPAVHLMPASMPPCSDSWGYTCCGRPLRGVPGCDGDLAYVVPANALALTVVDLHWDQDALAKSILKT